MKNQLLALSMCLFALVGKAMSADDIYFSVDNIDVMQGKTAKVTMYYNAEKEIYKGFQVEMTLPDGLHVVSASTGAVLVAAMPSWGFIFNDRHPGSGKTVFMGYQGGSSQPFPTGEAIELFSFVIKADTDMATGEYVVKTSRLELSNAETRLPELFEEKTLTINVTEYAQRVISEDDADIPVATAQDVTDDVIVKRTIKADTWSTLCLPFSLSAAQVTEAFGDDVFIAFFTSESVNERGQYVLTFEKAEPNEGVPANYPCLVKVTKEISEFTANDVIVDPDEEGAVQDYTTGTGSEETVMASFKGVLHSGFALPKNSLFIRDNKFYAVTSDNSTMKGLRGYFTITGYEFVPYNNAAPANVVFTIGGEETSIEGISVNGNETVNGDVYTLSGIYMGRAESVMQTLPRGIYLINNKKVIVK